MGNINQGFDGSDDEFFKTKGKGGNSRGFREWYYINFPCTVYRGSEKRGIDYETYLGMDDNAITAYRPKATKNYETDVRNHKNAAFTNQGVRNVIAAAPEMTEALRYGNFSLDPKSSRESYAGQPFGDAETTGSELYAFDIQDYLVTFPRLSNVGRSGRVLPVVFIAGGVYYDDATLLWEQDYYSREAEYQPNQELSDYTPQSLMTSSAITGDYTVDSLKYGQTTLSAEDIWDNFLPGANFNPHDDPNYPAEDDNLPCDSSFEDGSSCKGSARTGPMHWSEGYLGKGNCLPRLLGRNTERLRG